MNLEPLKESFGELYELLSDQSVLEVIIDSPDDIYYEKDRAVHNFSGKVNGQAQLQSMVQAMAKLAGKQYSEEMKNLRITLGDVMIHIASPLISRKGYVINWNRVPNQIISLDDLVKWKAINQEGADIIQKAIKDNKSILCAGGVGSGITTLCGVLLNEIPPEYRVVSLEVTPTLNFNRKRQASLVTPNNKRSELSDIVEVSEMMRADYLVLNEILGKEAHLFCNLLRNGHSGVGIIKASNIFDALKRLEAKILCHPEAAFEDAKYAISEAFDVIVYQERFSDGSRKITGVAEIKFIEGELKLDMLYRNKG